VPSVRFALAIFVAGTTLLAFLAYRWYRSHVEYCEDSPEVGAGGDALSCLEPQHWFAFDVGLAVLLLLEIGLVILVGAALVHRRHKLRRTVEGQ
jgi:hypothetical protein